MTKREHLTPETSVENRPSASKLTCCQWTLKKFCDGNKSLISSVKYVVGVMLSQGCLFATFSGKSVKRFAKILSQMKILAALDAKLGELYQLYEISSLLR